MKKLNTRQIALNGIVAGLYAAITILTASFAYGNIQFRISEALMMLLLFEPHLTIGLTLAILVSPEKDKAGNPTGEGQVFMSIDNTDQLGATLSTMTGAFGVSLNPKQIETFKSEGLFGVPMGDLSTYLTMNASKRPQYLQTKGIPLDSIKGGMSEFQQWVDAARNVNEDIKIALKADASTPYKTVKRVMNELQDMDESHYYMITQLKQQGDE